MLREKPLLKIRISGPGVRSGRIPVPLLLQVCKDAQAAINRQAQALEGRRSEKTLSSAVVQECTLELIALKKGSTTLDFAPATGQLPFPELASIGSEAVTAVGATLKDASLKRGRRRSQDLGVLDALDDLGSVFDQGVNKLNWIVPAHNGHKRSVAELIPATRSKIKLRKQQPLPLGYGAPAAEGILGAPATVAPENDFLEGMLELTDGKCRISPAVGVPTVVSFGEDKAENVIEATHKPVRVRMDPRGRRLMDIEITPPPAGFDIGDFFAPHSIDHLIAEQGVRAITNLDLLTGAIPDEDVDGMVAQIYKDREVEQ
jgi:hypothetical protein